MRPGIAAARHGMVGHALVLGPAVLVPSVFARPLPSVFGPHYAATGVAVLVLSALSALPDVVVRAAVATARVQRRSVVLVVLPAATAVLVFGGTWVLAPRLGPAGVGAVLLAAQTLVAGAVLVRSRR